MLYWTAAMTGAGIALMLTSPSLRTPPRAPSRRPVGAVALPLGDRRATDRAVARLEAMIRRLDAAPASR